MTCMSRIFAPLIILMIIASCSTFPVTQVFPLIKTAVVGADDFEISDDFINQMKYSFLKIKIGKSAVAIFVLSKIESDEYTWINSTGEKIVTKNGKIFLLSGLDIGNFSLFAYPYEFNKEISNEEIFFSTLRLENPLAYVDLSTSYYFDYEKQELHETTKIDVLKKTYRNLYKWNNGKVVYSEQKVHPNLPILKINYYYK